MAHRMPFKLQKARLAYLDKRLEDQTLSVGQRAEFTRTAERYRRDLAGRCQRCGRELRDPESVARGLGSECVNKGGARAAT